MVDPDSGSIGNVMTKPGKKTRLFYCKISRLFERIVLCSSLPGLAGNALLLAVAETIEVQSTD